MNQEDVLILKVVRELLENQTPTQGELSALKNIGLPALAALDLSLDEFKPGDAALVEDPVLMEIKEQIQELFNFLQKKDPSNPKDPANLGLETIQQIQAISQDLMQIKKILEEKNLADQARDDSKAGLSDTLPLENLENMLVQMQQQLSHYASMLNPDNSEINAQIQLLQQSVDKIAGSNESETAKSKKPEPHLEKLLEEIKQGQLDYQNDLKGISSNLGGESISARKFRELGLKMAKIEGQLEQFQVSFGQLESQLGAFEKTKPELSKDSLQSLEELMTRKLKEIKSPSPKPINTSPESQENVDFDSNPLGKLRALLFQNQADRQVLFPKAILFNPRKGSFPAAYFWVGEKIGLHYIILVNCASDTASELLSFVSNHYLNELIRDSKFVEPDAILNELDQRLHPVYQAYQLDPQQDRLQVGISAWDGPNQTMYFSACQAHLFVSQHQVAHLKGNSGLMGSGQLSLGSERIQKYTLSTQRGMLFYMSLGASNKLSTWQSYKIFLENHLESNLSDMESALSAYVGESPEPELLVLGFMNQ